MRVDTQESEQAGSNVASSDLQTGYKSITTKIPHLLSDSQGMKTLRTSRLPPHGSARAADGLIQGHLATLGTLFYE
jgi:hypothetical protein